MARLLVRGTAFLLLILTLALTACGGSSGSGNPGASSGGSSTSGDADRGKALFTEKQCITCHTLTAVPGANGTIGPNLDHIATTAATRKPNTSAADYIRESIKDPNAFIVPGYPSPSPMILPVPVNDNDINNLVAFLLTQR